MLNSIILILTAALAKAINATSPGQPTVSGLPGQFKLIGESLVSAQQVKVVSHILHSPF